ncbi:MAG: hypothetical protein NTY99_00405 [DPANN group archaeon]|nr:hypothetical protein [DPANN group archaeon]
MSQVELKVGSQAIPFEFSMEQFIQYYMYANQKQFDPNVLAEDVLNWKSEGYLAIAPFASQAAFLEGAPVTKVRTGLFSKKPVQEPSRNFLLFKDEYFKEIPAPQNELTQKNGGLWPFVYDPYTNTTGAAGKLYSTGKRIILDAYYTDLGKSEFAASQVFGKIDFQSFAGKFGSPHLTLKKFIKRDAKGIPQYEPFLVVGLENDVEYRVWTDSMSFLGGAIKVNIPGSEKAENIQIKVMLKGLDGSKSLQNIYFIYGISEELDKEIGNLQPTKLEDIVAMWQYAASNKFLHAATRDGFGAAKGQVSLKV